jgi:hypothetical protein
MSRKLIVALLVIVVFVAAVALNGDRLYGWLLAMHGGHAAH